MNKSTNQQVKQILIRVDASVQIGTGHVMRCLTIADELRRRGVEVIFSCREFEGNLCDFIEEKDYIVRRLPVTKEPEYRVADNLKQVMWLGADWRTDARQVEKIIKDSDTTLDWIVVDHYALDERWEAYLRPYCKKIMVIDDLADRAHDCDLLLDQNYFEDFEHRYDALVPAWCKKFLRPKYALLRPEFREARETLKKRDGHVKKIMIFFGGIDPTNETAKAMKAIRKLNRVDIAVDVVVGAFNPHRKIIEQIASEMQNCTCHFKVEDMAGLMAMADLAVGAGGTTLWERCVLGLPSLVITIAENQEKTVFEMAESGYLLFLGRSKAVSVDFLNHALEIAIQSPRLLISFSRKTLSLIDGKGVKRIAQEMKPLEIILRMATMDDCETILDWRNAEDTRRYSFDSGLISMDEHRRWFMESLENPNRKILIAELFGRSVGVIRYEIDGQLAEISIYTVPGIQGNGIGTQIIRTGSNWLRRNFSEVNKIRAKVLPENVISKKAFVNAGYTEHHIIFEKVLIDEL